jgi:hypothetical protein
VALREVLNGLDEEERRGAGARLVAAQPARVRRRLAVLARTELDREAAGRALILPAHQNKKRLVHFGDNDLPVRKAAAVRHVSVWRAAAHALVREQAQSGAI